ncbi:CZB domain-containing protein [Glaciimonas sp. Gout2]|uniref:CZB domain-containing protein n=1 Tax=unclassified Glaciimonas TaxID=2644401 RepID=UPI002AB34A14|nr:MULTISPECIES: CZB domain-containing protein [unclassified Glaciimonas]MDY7548653.1 CZB domain-containing protein [Glaciimonas sp. CA11.2]MEB0014038.1 CZB domain-containing protein [Glaciimonas sp. Cout2]MEB0084212.1 CZB domain-containing protein [Glaciimonas sp. Gout2]
MLKFFKNIFGADSNSKQNGPNEVSEMQLKTIRELNVSAAIAAHENWKIRLDTYLAGKSSEDLRPEVICFDNRCDLGKWLHGSAREQLGKYASFQQLVAEHKNFHYHASNVVSLNQSGKKEEAQKLLTNGFQQSSERVIRLLGDIA